MSNSRLLSKKWTLWFWSRRPWHLCQQLNFYYGFKGNRLGQNVRIDHGIISDAHTKCDFDIVSTCKSVCFANTWFFTVLTKINMRNLQRRCFDVKWKKESTLSMNMMMLTHFSFSWKEKCRFLSMKISWGRSLLVQVLEILHCCIILRELQPLKLWPIVNYMGLVGINIGKWWWKYKIRNTRIKGFS